MFKKVIISIFLISFTGFTWGASLQDNNDGTVSDFDTGLVWQQTDDNRIRTWLGATSYCGSLSLASKTDWRLPNAKELASIVDYRVNGPAIDDAAFPGTNLWNYWSASSYASNSANAWRVHFGNGTVSANNKTFSYYVRCVR